MSSPSGLGDLGYQVTQVIPFSTSTAITFIKTSGTDTGTKLTTGRTIDLSRLLTAGSTGGKPLDATVHPRASGPPRFKSLSVALGGEVTFHTSGNNFYVAVAHKTRSAASGAGSTWVTIKTDTKRFKMGTDTDAVFQIGLVSSINTQAIKKFYKANITYSARFGSSTAAKDTTSAVTYFVNSALVILSGADAPQNAVPALG